MNEAPNILVVIGPTASGKSDLAISVAEAADGVVINADSMQLYQDLSVLTARPNAEELARVPHRLYGVLAGGDPNSAQLWRDRAEREIRQCLAEGKLPILCGGTGFYLKAMMEGLSPIPEIPHEIRVATRADIAAMGSIAAWEILSELDRVASKRIEPTDGQRIARALEVYRATGHNLTYWHQEPLSGPPEGFRFLTVALNPLRAVLNKRCDLRFDRMIEQGALAEVEHLLALNLPPDAPIMKAVGVPELAKHLAGALSLEEAAVAARTATRRYAKRQQTWLKSQIISTIEKNEQFSERLSEEILSFIREMGLIRD